MQIDKPTIKAIVNEVIDEHPTIQRMAMQIGGLDSRVGGLEIKVDGLDARVGRLETDVAELKTDVRDLNSRFETHARTTNYSINQLHDSFQKMSVTMEDIKAGINKVIEIVMPSKQREEQFDQIEDRVEQHDHRIGALEVSVKDHLAEHEG